MGRVGGVARSSHLVHIGPLSVDEAGNRDPGSAGGFAPWPPRAGAAEAPRVGVAASGRGLASRCFGDDAAREGVAGGAEVGFVEEIGEIDRDGDTRIVLRDADATQAQVRFDLSVQRSPEGRRSLPEVDHRARVRRE